MIVLDTSYVSLFQYPDDARANALRERLAASPDRDVMTTAITPEEQMRGWLSAIHSQRDVQRQVQYYERLIGLFRFFADWRILPFDSSAPTCFVRFAVNGSASGPWISRLPPSYSFMMRRCCRTIFEISNGYPDSELKIGSRQIRGLMSIENRRQLENTRTKLQELEQVHVKTEQASSGDKHVRELTLRSLKKRINQFKEEIARFEARSSGATRTG